MEMRQKTNRTGKRVFSTLALLLIAHFSFLISSCPNTLITSVVYGYNVTYLDYDGTYMRTQPIYKGYPIKRWSNPQKLGYKLYDWCDDPSLSKTWDWNKIPQSDMELYANWNVDDNTIIGMYGQPIPNNRITIRNGENVSFQSAGGFSNHSWMLNGINDSNYNDSEWYYFTTYNRDKELGKDYILSLSVMNGKDGKYYSSSVTIRIPNATMTIRTQPKLSYTEGDMLDLSALEVTLTYDDSFKPENVKFSDFALRNIIVSPPNGAPLYQSHNNQQIIVSYDKQTLQTNRLTVGIRN